MHLADNRCRLRLNVCWEACPEANILIRCSARGPLEYRFEAASVAGFVQQLAVAYLAHGYCYYVAGRVPEGKDPRVVDEKLLSKYGIAVSRWARARRKREGSANMHYLRFGRLFVLVATAGAHEFFAEESGSIRDFRRDSLCFAGYSIGWKKGRDGRGHPSVRIIRSATWNSRATSSSSPAIARLSGSALSSRGFGSSRTLRFESGS